MDVVSSCTENKVLINHEHLAQKIKPIQFVSVIPNTTNGIFTGIKGKRYH